MTRESHAASADSSGSGRALAFPSSTWMAGVRGIRSRIAADGSTARTLRSNQSLKAAANWPGPRADVDQNHSLRRAQVTSDRLAPLPKSVAWDLADRLVGCSGAFVIADPGHAMPPLMPTSCLPQKRDVAEAPIQPLTRCAASFHRRTATSGSSRNAGAGEPAGVNPYTRSVSSRVIAGRNGSPGGALAVMPRQGSGFYRASLPCGRRCSIGRELAEGESLLDVSCGEQKRATSPGAAL
jgi:hypothetical protein